MHDIANKAYKRLNGASLDPDFQAILKLASDYDLTEEEIHMMYLIYRAPICEYDIDGTAMNTEPKIREAINLMASETGITLSDEHWSHLGGIGDKKVFEMIAGWHAPFGVRYESGEKFEKARVAALKPLIKTMQPNLPVWKAIASFTKSVDHLGRADKAAIAVTNSQRDMAEANLETGNYDVKFGHMTVAGQHISAKLLISEDEVLSEGAIPKPHPHGYEMGYLLSRLDLSEQGMNTDVSRSHVITFEDSKTGLRAALANGHIGFQITDLNKPADESTVKDWIEEGREIKQRLYGTPDAVASTSLLPVERRYFAVTLAQLNRITTPIYDFVMLRRERLAPYVAMQEKLRADKEAKLRLRHG